MTTPLKRNATVFGVQVIGQVVIQRGPDALVASAGIAFVGRVPIAVLCRQETPGRAGTGNPMYAGSETATVGSRPT